MDPFNFTFYSEDCTPLFSGKGAAWYLSICVMLASLSVLPAVSLQPNSTSPSKNASTLRENEETSLPNLQGKEAVEYLKRQGSYGSLQEAMAAARYKVYADKPGTGEYYAENSSLRMSMKFDDTAMRLIVKQPIAYANDQAAPDKDARARVLPDSKPRYRTSEASVRLIGAGYGDKILATTGEPVMTADANRFSYQHHLKSNPSLTPDHWPQITEWYENRAVGIEHGFTLNSPPMQRGGDEPLRVEMEFGGGFSLQGNADGNGLILSDRDGLTVSYDRLKVIDAAGKELAAAMKVQGRRVSIEVADLEALYPVTIDPLFSQVKKLTASDGEADDFFGRAVSISGDTTVVGAYKDASGRGSAYIFERNKGGANLWGEVTKLTASDGEENDQFGNAVSISVDTIVVGASADDANRGGAYVFERNQGGADLWGQVTKLTASDGAASDSFGQSVSISGDTIVVGALVNDAFKGGAYVFGRNQGGADIWGQVTKLTASDRAGGDRFGISVSISGDTILVGAVGDDSFRGSGYVFGRNQGGTDNWGEITKLTASDGVAHDRFGASVSISVDTIVVGASADDANRGGAYVFERNQGGADLWGEVTKLTASDGEAGDQFGFSVSISGDTILASAFADDSLSGSAYVFERNQGAADNWGELKKLTASDGESGDQFGISVSISGATIIVGADVDDSQRGAAYLYVNGCDNWIERDKQTASDRAVTDQFGDSVSISGDTIVVGAFGDDSFIGAAYVFERNQGGADNWGEVKKLTASDGAQDDLFGQSVSISGDTIVVGANRNDSLRGSAHVFERNQGGADNWGEVTKLTASDGEANDLFGQAVSICGDTIIVGAAGDDSSRGAAYVFERNQGGANDWGQVAKLTASDGVKGDAFGQSVSISGATIVVGAAGYDSFRGGAYVFGRNQGGADLWGEVTKLTASDGAANDNFGASVSISGDTIVVGARGDDSSQGSAYVYKRNQGGADSWGEVTKLTASDGAAIDNFGISVSISGDTILIGAPAHDSAQGTAYVYERNQGGADSWGQVTRLTASDGEASDSFGFSVSISGDTILVGALGDDAVRGASYIFKCLPDTEPPVITCPGNITVVGSPGQPTVVVNFPDPIATDDSGVASIVCTPPSGSAFRIGTTIVTCTATDTAGNQSSCSFTVTTFDVCLQDDSSSSKVLLWNSVTGDYLFCCGGTVVSGTGTPSRKGNYFMLTHYGSDRRLTAQVDNGTHRGSASLQKPVGVLTCSITDRDTSNNGCSCSAPN